MESTDYVRTADSIMEEIDFLISKGDDMDLARIEQLHMILNEIVPIELELDYEEFILELEVKIRLHNRMQRRKIAVNT